VYLGAQVPLADLLATVETLKPAVVCLSATTADAATQLGAIGRAVSSAAPNVVFGYGGRAFNVHPELRASMPGVFLGRDARELADTIALQLQRGPTSAAGERT
jgi:hypothetical protein